MTMESSISSGGVACFAGRGKNRTARADADQGGVIGREPAWRAGRAQVILGRMTRLVFALMVLAALAAAPARADQNDPQLKSLFATLKSTKSEVDARTAELEIWRIWTENKNPEIERLMQRGMAAMASDDDEGALAAFDKVTKYDKNFAEGWNKRATVEFAMGDFEASVADIERTLALEPRHFGALSGLGQIYLALDRKKLALKAFKDALAIDPHLDEVRQMVEELEKDVQGTPL
jgi:tetratricopeptide (TPR) repeat protein